jgi:hypothetical protein
VTELLQSLLNPLGFESVEPGLTPEQNEAFEMSAKANFELCMAFKQVFSTPHGAVVLQHLREMTLENSTWCASLGLEKGVPHGYAREGQNAMYRYIVERINEADRIAKQKKSQAKSKLD